MNQIILDNFSAMERICREFAADENNLKHVADAAREMADCLRRGGRIISCGNGGSLCDAMHFAEELSARFRKNRRPLPAVAVSDAAYLTCVANDFGFEQTVSRFVEAMGHAGDVLLAISTSGDSPNIVHGAKAARGKGMTVIALTGKEGGELACNCELEIRAPRSEFSDRVQEIHIKVIHTLVQLIEHELGLDE